MDCEKFESTMIDELYGELDELTSAAAKRHLSGCARCSSMLSGLKATRHLAVLPMVEVPAGLEERILAAAKEAQKVVPIRSRVSRAVSWAGSWAMRPQTAMAALFLLMIGSSALLLRNRAHKSEGVAVRVTEQGAPAPQEVQAEAPFDSKEASKAHGAPGRRSDLAAAPAASAAPPSADPVAIAAATATATTTPQTGTLAPLGQGSYGYGSGGAAGGKAGDRDEGAASKALALNEEDQLGGARGASNAGPVAGAARPRMASPAPPPAARPSPKPASPSADDSFADLPKDKEAKKDERNGGSDSDAAASAYRSRNYGEAARLYDELAKRGDKHAALQAARSVRENSGCSAAVSRLDALSASAWGSDVGYDATLEAGYCYNALGNIDLARARFSRLLTVSSHSQRAQVALNSLNAVATRKSAAPAKAAPQATQAPANARPAQPQSQSKPTATTDTASGF